MLFNSFHFLIFCPLVLLLHYLLAPRFRWVLLLLASYYFYMSWNPWYLGLILLSTAVDYIAAIKIDQTERKALKKRWLYASIITNLGILFTFKYFNFFADSLQEFLQTMGLNISPVALDLILPVGISFYTFQTISYTVDVYRGQIKPERHLGHFALFVSFFPQLVAGPIERAGNLLPQFKKQKKLTTTDVHTGINRILYGLFKKVVIADQLAFYVDHVFSDIAGTPGLVIMLASFFFLVQVYCDFSGYSDIAIGVAQLLGFKLMINFSRPFLSTSFTEYWQRWHISLSQWVRDYIYIPLGGNRVSTARLSMNLLLAFTVMGLWHGASWTFVLWGILHGTMLVLERFSKKSVVPLLPRWVSNTLGWTIVMITFGLSMIFFRAENTPDAFLAFQKLSEIGRHVSLRELMAGQDPSDFYLSLSLILVLGISYLLPQSFNFKYNFAFGFISLGLIILLGVDETIQFVYFQF